MPWTEITRLDYDRRGLRYASDTTNAEWALIAPFLEPRSKVGRPREVDMRDVWDAIQYITAAGCPWRLGVVDLGGVHTEQPDLGLFDDQCVTVCDPRLALQHGPRRGFS